MNLLLRNDDTELVTIVPNSIKQDELTTDNEKDKVEINAS